MIYKYQNKYQILLASQFMEKASFCILIIVLLEVVNGLYCSTKCFRQIETCIDSSQQGCFICAESIFIKNGVANYGTNSFTCEVLPQTYLVADELNPFSMNYDGYSTNSPSPKTCGIYTFSGAYTGHHYINKKFANIPLNHYELVIRFGIGYMGSWDATDQLLLIINNGTVQINHIFNYSCFYPQLICENSSSTEGIAIKEYIISHRSQSIFLNFTSLINQSDPSVKFWGIKSLLIAAKMCHPYCKSCFGPSPHECFACLPGFYIQSNTCSDICPRKLFKNKQLSVCSPECTAPFYGSRQADNSLVCLPCQSNCMMCLDGSKCLIWSPVHPYNFWQQKKQFLILLGLCIISIVGYLAYKVIKKVQILTYIKQRLENKTSVYYDSQRIGQINLQANQALPSFITRSQTQLQIKSNINVGLAQESQKAVNNVQSGDINPIQTKEDWPHLQQNPSSSLSLSDFQ